MCRTYIGTQKHTLSNFPTSLYNFEHCIGHSSYNLESLHTSTSGAEVSLVVS